MTMIDRYSANTPSAIQVVAVGRCEGHQQLWQREADERVRQHDQRMEHAQRQRQDRDEAVQVEDAEALEAFGEQVGCHNQAQRHRGKQQQIRHDARRARQVPVGMRCVH